MGVTRRTVLAAAAGTLALPAIVRAKGEVPIRIGEINSYSLIPAFTTPYRNGWKMAEAQINAAGGVLGRKLEVISRDDAGKPQNAIRFAGELLDEQKVDLLAGGYLSNIGLAISAYALRRKKLYVAGEPLSDALVWSQGNHYCYRLRPSTYEQAAMLVAEAAKLPGNKWVTVAPNYDYGQSAVKWFKKLLIAKRPDATFLGEQWPALDKIDAGATVAALDAKEPDNIFNVTFGADLTKFVRAGNTRGLFDKRHVVSMLTGEPEYLKPLGDEAPVGWIVTGYPVESVINTAGTRFIAEYRKRFKELPEMGSVVGHALITSIAAGIRHTGSTDSEKMADGFAGVAFNTPFGRAMWRKQDHQSTLGTYVGKTALKDGKGVMVDWRYVAGGTVLPSDAEVAKLRPAGLG